MSELAALVRSVHLAAAIVLVGALAFERFVARPAFSLATEGTTVLKGTYWRRQIRLDRGCVIILGATLALALWLQAANVSGGHAPTFRELFLLISGTQFGKVWLARAALLLLIALTLGSRRRETHPSGLLALRFALSVGFLTSMALAGHAAAADGIELAWQVIGAALHLMMSAVWLGALVPLALLLKQCLGNGATIVAQEATRRFSNLALVSVLILIATGVYYAWNLVGGFAPLFGTAYGKLLLGKLALLLILITIGAINRLQLKAKIVATSGRAEATVDALRRLSRNIIIEIFLGGAALLIVGHLGVTPPARHVQPDWPFPFRWDWTIIEKAPKAFAEVQRGTIWIATGVIALIGAIALGRRRVLATLIGIGALAFGVTIVHQTVMVDAYPDTYKRPAVAYQAISVANGAALYQDSGCATCHGESGHGDGPVAAELHPPPPDLTGRHANAHTAGDLFWWLSHGVKPTSAMPGFSQSLSDEERWDLINYLRALSSGARAKNLAPVIDEQPSLVAPDFTYGTNTGETKTLKDHRGNKIVLLVLLDLAATEKRLQQLAAGLPQLVSAGVEVIVVPKLIDYRFVADKLPGHIVNEGIREIGESYKLFARSFSDEAPILTPPHVEYLIDKQGYLRARWLAAEGDAWQNLDTLLKQVELLRREKPRAPAPDDHVH